MTKQEERNILAQMRKLAEPTFYLRETFDGVFDIAERNIDDDSVCNPVKAREDDFERKLKEDAERGQRILTIEHERDTAREYAENLEKRIFDLEHLCESKDGIIAELRRDATGCGEEVLRLRNDVAEKDAEIMRLKAMLFDYITKGEN